MDVQRIFPPHIGAELTDRLQKGQPFDIADGAADLDDGHVHLAFKLEDGSLDLIGDMRDYLHCAAQILATPFLADH